jgi:hypothetical protein
MFSIAWLNGGAVVESEVTALTNLQRVVDFARRRSAIVRQRNPGTDLSCFQVCDDRSGFVAVYMIEGGPGRSGISR